MDAIEYIKKEIENLELQPQKEEIGEVLEVKDGVAKISGLKDAQSFEIIKIEKASGDASEDIFGLVLSLEDETVGAIILGDFSKVEEGDIAKRTKKILSCPVGENLVSRVVNPLGQPLDERGEIKETENYPLERVGPSVIEREPVNYPLHTGLKTIDSLIPIGRGQRELVVGDRICQKTSLAVDTIVNQKDEPNRPVCIYVAIGKREAELAKTIETLRKQGAMEYTIVVSVSAADPASFWYLAPFAGAALGEYFMHQGQDALVIFDDLTKHAWAWREISLILKRAPGREAYPGDIFYLHSRLLERAAKLSQEKGGGSLTALPIVEIQGNDLTGYIPTNVISICDGQIFLDTSLYLAGQTPEVDVGLSVSRVGSSAQTKAMKKVASNLKLELAQFKELESFIEFSEEVDEETKNKIERGRRMKEVLKQDHLNPLPFEKQVVIIFAGIKGFLDQIKIEQVSKFEKDLFEYLENQQPQLLKNIKESRVLEEETETELEKATREVLRLNEWQQDQGE